jgi:hypothetical protein
MRQVELAGQRCCTDRRNGKCIWKSARPILSGKRLAVRKSDRRHGFTLREMFVIIAIIAVLLAILVPAVQKARESARQTQCRNNLKQLGISLLNYHDTYGMFPMGAMHSGPNPGGAPPIEAGLGPSWWFSQLPFYESSPLYDQIITASRSSGPVTPQFCADDMKASGDGEATSSGRRKSELPSNRCWAVTTR